MQAEVQGTGLPVHTVGIERLTVEHIQEAYVPNGTPGMLAVVERYAGHLVKVCITEDEAKPFLRYQDEDMRTVEAYLMMAGHALATTHGATWIGVQA